jgi:hypothetical protein
MRFWNRFSESEVEHTLRERRPQPSDDLVHRISRSVAPPRRGARRVAPKLALVGGVTVVLAASLGVTGALGYCGNSVKAFGNGVTQLVSYSHHDDHGGPQGNGGSQGNDNHGSKGDDHHDGNGGGNGNGNGGGNGNGNGGGNGGDGQGGDGDHGNGPPFDNQYGHKNIPICWNGQIIHVSWNDLPWFILHGAGPPWQCSNGHGGKHGDH